MRFRNHSHGYGLVTKLLHWLTLLALAGQVVVGYSIERADDLLEGAVDRWLGGEQERLVFVHAGLGVGILALAVVRATWRKVASLPDWAEGLSEVERRVAHRTEQVLYWMLFMIPLTGLGLLLVSGKDWDVSKRGEWQAPLDWVDDGVLLGAHIAGHVTLYVALAVHVGLVLKHQVVDRDRLLNRML